MSNESTATPTTESTATPQAKDPGELSFAEYQTYRRTGEMPKAEPVTSASAENKPAAHNDAKDSESPATEEKEETKDESEVDGDEPDAKDESDKDGKPKKKGGFQRRIDKLNARVTAREQEVEYWKQQALKGAGESKPDPKVEQSNKSTEGKPNPEKFDSHAEYVEALTDWKTEQKFKERDGQSERARLESAQANLVKTYQERLNVFKAKTPDFVEVEDELGDSLREAGTRPNPTMERIFLSSENGPELAYQLAKDPDEFVRICKLPPIEAAVELGILKAKLSSQSSADGKAEPKKVTQAPKPLEPVSGGKSTAVKKTPEEMSFSEYEKYRREQMKRKRA